MSRHRVLHVPVAHAEVCRLKTDNKRRHRRQNGFANDAVSIVGISPVVGPGHGRQNARAVAFGLRQKRSHQGCSPQREQQTPRRAPICDPGYRPSPRGGTGGAVRPATGWRRWRGTSTITGSGICRHSARRPRCRRRHLSRARRGQKHRTHCVGNSRYILLNLYTATLQHRRDAGRVGGKSRTFCDHYAEQRTNGCDPTEAATARLVASKPTKMRTLPGTFWRLR